MLALGVTTSVHCISMCGPMVVTYAVKGAEDDHWASKIVPNLAYQAAKITSYVLVGLLLGAIGSAFNLDGVRAWVMFAAGAFMIVLGLGMTGRVPWAARLSPRPPRALVTAISKLRRKATADAEDGSSTIVTPIAFGLLTGLMPCAPLQAAQLMAAGTGSVIGGGVAMLAFGIGTAPLMLGFGVASSLIPKQWKHRMTVVLAIVVMVFGAVFINRAATLVGSPVTFGTVTSALISGTGSSTANNTTTAADGVVEVRLVIKDTQYVPSTLSIPANTQVRMLVDRQEDLPCSNRLVLPQLGVDVPLADNAVTVVDIPPSPAGRYSMTCGMGMMSGTLVVGQAIGPGAEGSPLAWLGITLALTASVGYLVWRRRPKDSKGRTLEAEPVLLGLTMFQLVLVVGAMVAMAIVGLALGGFFS